VEDKETSPEGGSPIRKEKRKNNGGEGKGQRMVEHPLLPSRENSPDVGEKKVERVYSSREGEGTI